MKKFTLIFFILISISNLYAGVGLDNFEFLNKNNNRLLKGIILYPSDEKSDKTFAENIAFKGFEAKKDALIKKEKSPLIVFTHGTSGNWKNQSWLAAKLASIGYIVIAANHPGYTTGDSSASTVLKMWNQPKDVSFMLDSILKSKYKNFIDTDKIYTLGLSLGGYTSMALTGAKLDMKSLKSFCSKHDDISCKYFKKAYSILDNDFYKESSKDYKDERVKASIAIAPGLVPFMTNDSLKKIDKPVLVLGAEFDKNVPVKTQILPKIDSFSKSIIYEEIKDSSHFSFLQICKKGAKKILEEEDASFVCNDGNKKTRQTIHKEVYNKVVNFLNNL
ncbi:alpha/beta fold hydrolase [Halarcobacter sp.]|uniref:alpha/beta hydrolase family protein n=1 Tax=Halarcobacter sp. TaxID=2321133 RepID=UPI002AAA7D97|nr:alpha/beta fold hydrolase [Halarcobacter sp.]